MNISYHLEVDVETGTKQVTIDRGQTVEMDCSEIFEFLVFEPRRYVWQLAGTSDQLSTDATYTVTPDSDVSYVCIAVAFDAKRNPVPLSGTIEIIVRGTLIN